MVFAEKLLQLLHVINLTEEILYFLVFLIKFGFVEGIFNESG